MYTCVFDSYLWVASNLCVRSSAELSISVGLKLVEVNHSYFKKNSLTQLLLFPVFGHYLTNLVAECRSTKFLVSTDMDN